MKKKFLLLVSALVILSSCLLPAFAADSKPTTEVLYYEQKIDPRSDYSLDVEYHLKFKVISTEKDITWLKIPIQNSSIDNFEPISDNIDEICYYEENNKNYIRVNLTRIFSEGDIVEIKFSLHQSDVYTINNNIIYYSYIVNGFSNIAVNELVIHWNSKKVLESSSSFINSDSYYVWNSDLESDEKFNIFMKYDLTQFEEIFDEQESEEVSNEEDSETNNEEEPNWWSWGSFFIGLLIGVLLCFVVMCMLLV